jgi:peptidoglycan/LPS O-acetylase OafA/YrhL
MTDYFIGLIVAGVIVSLIVVTLVAGLVARAGFPLPPEERRTGSIDGLRGYLALSVFVHHFVVWTQITFLGGTWSAPSQNFLNQLGVGGVALFFMTTGFVFYPRVLTGFRACSWPKVYIARFFRIIPMVATSLIAITVIVALRTGNGLDKTYAISAIKWITAWSEPPLLGYEETWRINAYVLWSLWYEWLFYLFVLPACALAMDLIRGRLPSWTVPVALLAASLTARALLFPNLMVKYLPLFAIGMLAYEFQRHESTARALRSPAAAGLATVLLVCAMFLAQEPFGFALPIFSGFFLVVACGNSLGGLLRTKGALVLGECSFSIYLLHAIVLNVLFVGIAEKVGTSTTVFLPVIPLVAGLLVVLISVATYLVVERPAIRIGANLRRVARRQLVAP